MIITKNMVKKGVAGLIFHIKIHYVLKKLIKQSFIQISYTFFELDFVASLEYES